MLTVTLGKTGITVNKNGFGCLPIQRISIAEAGKLLRTAYENGVQYFDTARAYSDSEKKIGLALSGVRSKIFLATKSMAKNGRDLRSDLEESLRLLKTDYIDVYQFHNPAFVPRPGGADGLYDEALKAQQEGKIRFIGLTNHRLPVAQEAVQSGLFATLQFPFSYLASAKDLQLVQACKAAGMGFVAMKSLSGGLITNGAAAYAFAATMDNVLPIWGMQRETELEEFLSFQENPPVLDAHLQAVIDKDRNELTGSFCRGCGYCLPCPAGIDIPTAARMSLMLRRAPAKNYLTPERQANMKKILDCRHCNHCKNNCPYGLDTPKLLKKNYDEYLTFLK